MRIDDWPERDAETTLTVASSSQAPSPSGQADQPMEGVTGVDGVAGIKTVPAGSHKAVLITLASVVGLLLLLTAAAFCLGRFYFDGRAPLGTSFAGQSVAGKDAAQLTEIVKSKAAGTVFALTGSDGSAVQAHYQDLGVKVDVAKTVDSLLGACGDNPFMKVNPLNNRQLGLVASVDRAALQKYLLDSMVPQGAQVVLPQVTYDPASQAFTVTPGRDGKEVLPAAAQQAVTASFRQPAGTVRVAVPLATKGSPISLAAAQAAAQAANKALSLKLTVSNGDEKSFTIPPAQIAGWTRVLPDPDKGTMTVGYDQDALAQYLQATLPGQLGQAKVDQKVLVTPSGQRVLVQSAGVDGVVVKDVSEAVAQVRDALLKGSPVTATVKTAVDKFQVVNVPVPSNYDVPNGDPHVVVDLSAQSVAVYRGTTLVKSFPMASGMSGWQTGDGTFYVFSKFQQQTMKTADPKGTVATCEGVKGPWLYCDDGNTSLPGHGAKVEWISYFDHRGIAFHSAPWNISNIAHGLASSHGCINMYPADAQWMFNFLSIGTQVKVVGSTPAHAVR